MDNLNQAQSMMKEDTMSADSKHQQGFTLIEVMVAMLIGSILMIGVFQVFFSSKEGQEIVYDQIELVDESRVSLEMLAFDIKKAGLWGKTNNADNLLGTEVAMASLTAVRDQLATANGCINSLSPTNSASRMGGLDSGWALDVYKIIFGVSEETITGGGFPYSGCISGSYLRGDTIEVRYAGEKVLPADLDATTVYIKSQGQFSEIFYGLATVGGIGYYADQPAAAQPPITYHRYEAVLYYVSAWTDAVGDGVPSLRRVSLQSGPKFSDDVVLTGVENLQIQFGVDLDDNEETQAIQQYLSPSDIDDSKNQWEKIRSVQAWMLVRSKQSRPENTAQTFTIPAIPGGTYTTVVDGYKRIMVTSTNKLRNIAMGGK